MTLEEFQHDPMIRNLLKEGFLYPKLTTYIEMYQYYRSKVKSLGNTKGKKMIAITWTGDGFRVSDTTVYVAIKKVKSLEDQIKDK